MCGRISQRGRKTDFVEFVYGFEPPEDLHLSNIKPTQDVLIVIAHPGEVPETTAARWWFQNEGAKEFSTKYTTFNAMAEKLPTGFLWRNAYRRQRCIVPVTSFYEWNVKGEPPLEIRVSDNHPFALAGLWSTWYENGKPRLSFTVVTTDPNDFMRPIHRRMPVVLQGKEEQKRWIDTGDPQLLLPFHGELTAAKLPARIEEYYGVQG